MKLLHHTFRIPVEVTLFVVSAVIVVALLIILRVERSR